jgi:hypothetical protein
MPEFFKGLERRESRHSMLLKLEEISFASIQWR